MLIAAVVLAALLATSMTLFVVRVRFLLALIRAAAPVNRAGAVPKRVRNETTIVLGQRKLLQRLGPGLIHAFIFWGFLVLTPTIIIAMIGMVDKHSTFPWLGHQGWFAFLSDLFAALVLIGVGAALWIRKVQRPRRFEGSHLGEADLILALIATIATTLLLWGDADPISPVAVARRLAELLPNSVMAVIRGGTHAVALEQPEAVAEAVIAHLA